MDVDRWYRGDITLRNNTKVGANAVVIKDYKRGHGTLAGVPAKPVREASDERLRELGVVI